jgi:hypothetical protein
MLVFDSKCALEAGKVQDFDAEGGGADAVLTEAIVRIRSGSLQSNDCDWLTGQTLAG